MRRRKLKLKKWVRKLVKGFVVLTLVLPASMPVGAGQALANIAEPKMEDYSGTQELQLELIGRYSSGAEIGESGAEIVSYDSKTKKAFIVNGADKSIDIVNLSNPHNLNLPLEKRIKVTDLDLGNFIIGDITSIAVHPNGDFIAFAVPAEPKTDNGRVVLADIDGNVVTYVEVGALPDMVTFTPDGSMVLVANEGEPAEDFSYDPEGSVSIIDVSSGVEEVNQDSVTTVGFTHLDPSQIDDNVRVFSPNATPAQDFEPEYIVVEPDSKTAYVVLQENNAIAKLDLEQKEFVHVYGLGFKDHSLPENALDVSDRDNEVNIRPWPVLGMYQPDGISLYSVNGQTYIVTANEGDARDWEGFSEQARIKSIGADNLALHADYYAGYTQEELNELVNNGLLKDEQLGRLNFSNVMGKNSEGKYEALYSYGARSFSIWNASNQMELVYDSGSDFEYVTWNFLGDQYFNANHTANTGEPRSDDKGPEPEDVKIGHINGQIYAFIGLERVGGIMTYNITDPTNPVFVTYYNSRDFTKDPESGEAGDLGTEGLQFVAESDSPTGKPLLLAANEVSGTLSIYEISTKADELFSLTIMHTNDTHAHLDNVARRITVINKIRDEVKNSILLDAGDVFSGTLFFNKYEGQADLEFMNMAGYDAMVPGNHEFDKGPKVFAEFIKNAEFPFVSANIDYSQEPELNYLFVNGIGKPAEKAKVYPAIMMEIDGEEVGIFGLTTEDTAFIANPGDKVVFQNYLEQAKATVEMLQQEGVNKIIALTHLGYNYDVQLAQQVEGIDIVIGGHSHTQLNEAVVFNPTTEPTIVVQANEYGKFIGRMDVAFDDNGVLKSWNSQLIEVDKKDANGEFIFAENEAAAAKLAQLKEPIEELKKTIVGKTDVNLDGERGNIRSKETNLGNLITDGMLSKAKESVNAQIAIQNGGGIRASIATGDITLGDILTVMPFANNLVTLELTGEELLEALENGVSKVEEGNGRFLQVAGLRFYYDRTQPAMDRVIGVEVKTETGYVPLDLKGRYIVATNAFVADGGDGFESLKRAKDDGRMTELFFPDYDVFTDYLNKIGKVGSEYGQVEGRITEATIPDFTRTAIQGKPFAMPEKVMAVTSSGALKEFAVEWESEIDTTTTGMKDAVGIVSGTSKKVKLMVIVAEGKAPTETEPENGKKTATFDNGVRVKGIPSASQMKAAELTDIEAPIFSGNIQPAGQIMKFDFEGELPAEGIELELPLNEDFTGNAGLAYFNESRNKWELVDGSQVVEREGKKFVKATVSHFSIYGALEMRAELIANKLTSVANPARNATTLTLPAVPEEYTIAIKSTSLPSVIATSGMITPPDKATTVSLILEVKNKEDHTDVAYTAPIVVNVPEKFTGSSSGGGATPAANKTSKVITASSGGVIEAHGAVLDIPSAAFLSDITITVEKLTNTSHLPMNEASKRISDVYEITKDKAGKFEKEITITLPYNKANINSDNYDIGIYWLNEETNKWISLHHSKVDSVNGKVSGTIDHFTKFAVLAVEKQQEIGFSDIRRHWAEEEILALVQSGAINGYPNGTFRPNNHITRAEFATVLVKAFNLEAKNATVFADTTSHWAREEISTASAYGIVTGYNKETFGPNDFITREQMALMIVRAARLNATSTNTSFTDNGEISSWAKAAVAAATEKGIINGYPNNSFQPKGLATRAEAVKVIVNGLE